METQPDPDHGAGKPENRKQLMLCLVVPTFNEGENVGTLIERTEGIVDSLPFGFNLVFVDDNSVDGTPDIIKGYMKRFHNIKLIQRPRPTGIGSAYMDGFTYSLSRFNTDYVGEMDADLQHPPEALADLCNRALKGDVDVILGSRYVKGGGSLGWSFGRRVVSKGANLLSKVFLRVPVADATTGLRVINAKSAKGLLDRDVSAKGYAFQVESLYVYKKMGAKFAEVPYLFGTRKAGKTKLDTREILRFASVTIRTGIMGVRMKKEERGARTISSETEENIVIE